MDLLGTYSGTHKICGERFDKHRSRVFTECYGEPDHDHTHNAVIFSVCKTQSLKVLLFLLVLPGVTACTYW